MPELNLKYAWRVKLEDGSIIQQFGTNGNERMWNEVPVPLIREFTWYSLEIPGLDLTFTVKEGQRCEPSRTNQIEVTRFGKPQITFYNVRIDKHITRITSDGEIKEEDVIE